MVWWLEQSKAWESGVVNSHHGTSPGVLWVEMAIALKD